jgi:hypothetical protein
MTINAIYSKHVGKMTKFNYMEKAPAWHSPFYKQEAL